MSCNDGLQGNAANVASDSMSLNSASDPTCEPMFELEGVEFNEEFLKALLNDGEDLSITGTAPLSSTDCVQQGPSVTSEQHLQPDRLPEQTNDSTLFQYSSQNIALPASMEPMLPSGIATSSKRTIKPRTQLSNEEITRLLLIYMYRALASQQNASTGRNKQGSNSAFCMQTSSQASSTTKGNVYSKSTDLLQCPKTMQSKSTDLQQSANDYMISKNKRKCKKSKSIGTNEASEHMDCDVSVSKEVHRTNAHTKVRPYNSLDLPKVHDPLGLMGHTKQKMHSMQQPKVMGTGKGVMRGSTGTAVETSSSEVDLSPLTQILQTVKTVPNFESASKFKGNQESVPVVDKILKNNLQEDKRSKKAPLPSGASDQINPISDVFNTVNNLPNLSDIQSVLKYVQKRRAMRKLFKRRSHSAGSIDDLKKESKSSASLKAYVELLKAKSQHLQRQLVPDPSSMNDLESCMTTDSTVTDDDFEFLRGIGIDPNAVTSTQNDPNDMTSFNLLLEDDKIQQNRQLQTDILAGANNLSHSKDSVISQAVPTVVPCSILSSELLPRISLNDQPPVMQCDDVQDLDHHTVFDSQMSTDAFDSNVATESNYMEEDNSAANVMTDIYFTPEWAHAQVLNLSM